MVTMGQLKTRLRAIALMDTEISSQEERLIRLRSKIYDIGSPEMTDMPRNPSPDYDKLPNALQVIYEIESHIKDSRDKARSERAWVERVVSELTSQAEKDIIRWHYIDKESWKDILVILYSKEKDFRENEEAYAKKMYRIHGNALEHMRQIIAVRGLW